MTSKQQEAIRRAKRLRERYGKPKPAQSGRREKSKSTVRPKKIGGEWGLEFKYKF